MDQVPETSLISPGDAPRASAAERFEVEDEAPQVGQWYWVGRGEAQESTALARGGEEVDDSSTWLGCVVHVGSNYAELRNVHEGSERIHLEQFKARCRPEPRALEIIAERVQRLQAESARLLGDIRLLTERLSVSPVAEGQETSHALVVSDKGKSLEAYKGALLKAKDVELPALFERIKAVGEEMAAWMKAGLIPVKAQARRMKGSIKLVEARIFNIELYAGLSEQVVLIKDGAPAPHDTPIHLFQRRHYMDEECLAGYEAGGMSFEDIGAFDEWLARPVNLQRILPHPRSIIAFRVRRHEKEREGHSLHDFIRFAFAHQADKSTFLYVRNGERVYRLETSIEFGERLFPDFDRSRLTGLLYARISCNSVEKLIPEGEWLEMQRREEERARREEERFAKEEQEYPQKLAAYKQALVDYERALAEYQANPEEMDRPHKPEEPEEPYLSGTYRESERYERFTPESVHYDDCLRFLQQQMDEHNRLVVVLQGLLDRSEVLHPHPRWKLMSPEGFEAALRLVYDDTRALVASAPPDFEAYRASLNAQLAAGCVTVGQERYWLCENARKENEKRHWRDSVGSMYAPNGDPGPGVLARVEKVGRDGMCHFSWMRERRRGALGLLRARTQVPVTQLLNVSAYKPGDFRRFYADPRTRAEYLKWAPLLLVAEEYHAGKRGVGEG